MDKELIKQIQDEMEYWFGFNLTEKQVEEYINKTKISFFDTVEREDLADDLGRKITGMGWPINADQQDYKDKFYELMRKNAEEKGYTWGKQ